MVINVQCTSFITIWNDKKMLFALARLVLAFGLFLGFFWPSEGLRPSSGQKIPKNSPQVKTTRLQQKKIFVLPHVDIVVHFTLIYTISCCLFAKTIQILQNPRSHEIFHTGGPYPFLICA